MPVEVGAKQVEPATQVENVLFAQELAPGCGFHQYEVEFVKSPLGHHVHVRNDLVAFRVPNQIDA
jgi:hypothetical protein